MNIRFSILFLFLLGALSLNAQQNKNLVQFSGMVLDGTDDQLFPVPYTNILVKDKGIEATLQLANSQNAKVIVVGGEGGNGLPLILGGN
jgi:hypothetical protein